MDDEVMFVRALSDHQLVKMLSQRGDYRPELIAAAEVERQTRSIDGARHAEILEAIRKEELGREVEVTPHHRQVNCAVDCLFVLLLSGFHLGGFILAYLAYCFVCEAITGRTLGKVFTRTRVVAQGGAKATPAQIAVRTLVRCIPLEPLSGLRGGRAWSEAWWHDRLSGTHLVRDPIKQSR